jgi:DNA transposition AAA+ family ATPase
MTVRLPIDLYEAGSKVAKRRRVSLNQLVQDSLRAVLKDEADKALYDAFTLVALDKDEVDVEYALEAQREVIFRDEP